MWTSFSRILAVTMAFLGRNLINKFQIAASEHIPILGFYEQSLNSSRIELLKFETNNKYSDTLVTSRDNFDFQVILIYTKIKELKKTYCFGPNCSDFGSFSCNLNSLEDIVIVEPSGEYLMAFSRMVEIT